MNAKKNTLWIALSVLMWQPCVERLCSGGYSGSGRDATPGCETPNQPPRRSHPALAVFSTAL